MTYHEEDSLVPEMQVRVEDNGIEKLGNYIKLSEELEREAVHEEEEVSSPSSSTSCGPERSLWFWIKIALLLAFLAALALATYKWLVPLIMDKELIPIIKWEMKTFTHPVLGILIFATVALLPVILLPSTPSMWVAGITFGYGYGFLLTFPAMAVGVSLPYFISYLFCDQIQGWLERYPDQAAMLRAAGGGNWFHQFRAVTLIRISPFPYVVYNYCAVATRVKYGPYIAGSLLGMVPENFVAIYTGILIRKLADASTEEQKGMSVLQIVFDVLGFVATVLTTVLIMKYAKRQLEVMKMEEEASLLQ
ncbi:SNARE associated Golgi protein family [Hirschfeldia incana]|nr:SNARE associated Golgi protein family [Hirschfeldia incana]